MDFTIGKETELQHLVSLPAVWPQMDLRGGLPQEPLRDGPPGGQEHFVQLRTLQLLRAGVLRGPRDGVRQQAG